MHELSICAAITRIVEDAAGGQPVRVVRLDVGHLRQVVPDTLRYCWDIAVADTPLHGAALEIDHVPARLACRSCSAETEVSELRMRCGTCGTNDVELIAGDELLVRSIDLAEPLIAADPPNTVLRLRTDSR